MGCRLRVRVFRGYKHHNWDISKHNCNIVTVFRTWLLPPGVLLEVEFRFMGPFGLEGVGSGFGAVLGLGRSALRASARV